MCAREHAVLNEYELDESGLSVHRFTRGVDWVGYIFDNRRAKDGLAADVVMGPIANDTIFDTLGIMSSGYLEPADALALLMIGPEYTQVAIKTQEALENLHFIGSERLEKISADQLKEEQEAFQEAFSQGIERIMGE